MKALLSLAGLVCVCLLSITPPVLAKQVSDDISPQIAHGSSTKKQVKAKDFMVATANPHATQAGYAVLKAGGNAFDAAVAVQLMLGLVEPQSSGLGGGALMVLWDAKKQELVALDGRETAPKAIKPEVFLDEEGEPLAFMDAVVGGRSVGTPGTLALLETIHKTYGSQPWASLFSASIEVAEKGFVVTPHMAEQVADSIESLSRFETTKRYFTTPEGKPLPAGYLRTNPDYATTLRTLAQQGAKGFYTGEIAQAIVNAVTQSDNPGTLSLDDLKQYAVKSREVVCVPYRNHDVCGMGPPTSGGLTIGQILGMLSHFDLKALGPEHIESWRLIGDASRLAFADRGRYIADSDFIDVPTKALIAPEYLAQRAALLKTNKALEAVAPGNPTANAVNSWGDDTSIEFPSTSHFVIADKAGNVISMTTTIENGFGSRLMTNGFLLNNELTDFSFKTEENGVPIANRVEPGKRPRSSMSPSMVLKDGKPYMAIGSPGGSFIIGYTAQAIIAQLDWGYTVQQAIDMPHRVNRFGVYDLEEGTDAVALQPGLEALGYKVNVKNLNSGLQGIVITPDGLGGGADPRRDGVVMGD